ncbi:MAG: 50S ribosomal protein L32 [Deltaproteobacteria bacterium]|nr:50S ribosomal protein L32 [Candidatus Zymogenaceae bacterium]
MAVPKRKHSRSRKGKRRSHQGLVTPPRSICPQCTEVKMPHVVCPHCGYYKGREVVQIEEV